MAEILFQALILTVLVAAIFEAGRWYQDRKIKNDIDQAIAARLYKDGKVLRLVDGHWRLLNVNPVGNPLSPAERE